jgi:hypothetical protein
MKYSEYWFEKDMVLYWFTYYTRMCMEGLRKTRKLCQDNRDPGSDSNRRPYGYKSEGIMVDSCIECTLHPQDYECFQEEFVASCNGWISYIRNHVMWAFSLPCFVLRTLWSDARLLSVQWTNLQFWLSDIYFEFQSWHLWSRCYRGRQERRDTMHPRTCRLF